MSDFTKSSGNLFADVGDPQFEVKQTILNALAEYRIRLLEAGIVSIYDRQNSKDVMRGVFNDVCALLPKVEEKQ